MSRAVETALTGAEASELSWLDPRSARTDAAARARAARHPPPTDAVVFVVGGGNYIEYHNLIDFAKVFFNTSAKKTLLTLKPSANILIKLGSRFF